MVDFVVVVEGGGRTEVEQTRLRKAFTCFLKNVMDGGLPRVLAAGGRSAAFKAFATERRRGRRSLLLVDSEGPVQAGSPWDHVAKHDGWQRPADATDDELHFMVETMETWLVADPDALASYYGHGFKRDKLPSHPLESQPRADVAKKLEAATRETKTKGAYTKAHGLDLIGRVDPTKVRGACGSADRFLLALAKKRT